MLNRLGKSVSGYQEPDRVPAPNQGSRVQGKSAFREKIRSEHFSVIFQKVCGGVKKGCVGNFKATSGEEVASVSTCLI